MNESRDERSDWGILEYGRQPLDVIMTELGLANKDLVQASGEQLTHKMVQKGRRGRRLTRRVQEKILRALQAAYAGRAFTLSDLFIYVGRA